LSFHLIELGEEERKERRKGKRNGLGSNITDVHLSYPFFEAILEQMILCLQFILKIGYIS
jgi:hypothetical protein